MTTRLPAYALLIGNFVVAATVLAPAAMLKELAVDLHTSFATAGLLVTFGAVILCIGSPVVAWATSAIPRRTLLTATVAIIAAGHLASAFAPSYEILLSVRVATLAVAAIFTPQAASTIALIVPEKERSGAIALVFLGWSLAVAAGLPLVTFLAATFGWREAHSFLAAIAAVSAVLLAIALPNGLLGARVSFQSWGAVFRSRTILLILLVTVLSAAGQFLVLTYLGPLLTGLASAQAGQIAFLFGAFGVTGFIGNLTATRIVGRLGSFATSTVCLAIMLAGMLLWSLGSGSIGTMTIGIMIWGLGFASGNSMQQARLVSTAPDLASATIALNTSSIYVGQTVGSGAGGVLVDHGLFMTTGYVAAMLMACALATAFVSRSNARSLSA